MPSASLLTNVELKSDKQSVKRELGQPESVSLAFTTMDGRSIEVWEYRLYQYKMATSLSPYFDIYSFIFMDGILHSYQKTEKGARLSEEAALKIIGIPDKKVDVTIK